MRAAGESAALSLTFDPREGSVAFGSLGALGAGGTAGCLVVGVNAEPSLDHHEAVGASVLTALVCQEDRKRTEWVWGRKKDGGIGIERMGGKRKKGTGR